MPIDIIRMNDIPPPQYKPKSISKKHNKLMFKDVPTSVKDIARKLMAQDWKFCAVNQQRGYCHYDGKVITIPVWVISNRDITEKIWYICHEMSHALVAPYAKHGPLFMNKLQEICPPDCIHHEISYKPRNARSAGISSNPSINNFIPLA